MHLHLDVTEVVIENRQVCSATRAFFVETRADRALHSSATTEHIHIFKRASPQDQQINAQDAIAVCRGNPLGARTALAWR